MFGFNKRPDADKVKAFADWFFENEERIRKSVENCEKDRETMLTVLDEVGLELVRVYSDGFDGEPEFDYGGKADEWELNLYHLNKRFLIAATGMIAEEFSSRGSKTWTVTTSR